jgi:hypothetical protein
MKLSTDILTRIIGRADVNFDQDGTRRFASRVSVTKRATVCRLGSKVPIPVTIVDLSIGGVGLLNITCPAPGDQFILNLCSQTGERISVQCVVRWAMEIANSRYRVGAEFVSLVDADDSQQPMGATSDKSAG